MAVLVVGSMLLPASALDAEVVPQVTGSALLADEVEGPSGGDQAALAETSRRVRYVAVDPVELADQVVDVEVDRGQQAEGSGCRLIGALDASVAIFDDLVAFEGVEATQCRWAALEGDDEAPAGSIEWHGQLRDGSGDLLAVGSLGFLLDEDGRPDDAVGFFQYDQGTYELMPVGGGISSFIETDPSLAPDETDHDHDHGEGDGHDVGGSDSSPEGTEVDGGDELGGADLDASVDGEVPSSGRGDQAHQEPVGDARPGGGGDDDDAPLPPEYEEETGLPGDAVGDAATLVPGQARAGGPPGNRVIRVLFAFSNGYTSAQRSLFTLHRTTQTNNSFINSGMPVRMESTGPLALSYDQSSSLYIDLDRLQHPSDGFMDDAWFWFEAAEADALALFVPNAPDYCGLAYLNMTVDARSHLPFGITSTAAGCDLTFTHELGHNLGAHHNPENAGVTAFPWAYGHYSSGRARTVMSYANPCTAACPRVAQFSDPDDSFIGFPGVPSGLGYRDNDRAITDLSWAMSQYGASTSNDYLWYRNAAGTAFTSHHVNAATGNDMEAPYTPLAGDFNGDGRTDQFWYFPGRPLEYLWTFGGAHGTYTSTTKNVGGNYRPVVGDFDGDGRDDIFWHGPGSVPDSIWWGTPNPADFGTVQTSLAISGSYYPEAGDIDGDGRDDIVWYAPGSAPDPIWWGNASRSAFAAGTGATWHSVTGLYHLTIGDFDGDGRDDLFWYAPGSGTDFIWRGRAGRDVGPAHQVTTTVAGSYRPFAGDFDGDGRDDVLWYGPGPAYDTIWLGQASLSAFVTPHNEAISVAGYYEPTVGDFDGDGRDDVFWFAFG